MDGVPASDVRQPPPDKAPRQKTDESEYYTAQEAAFYLRLPSVWAFYQMRRRFRQPRGFRLGRNLLFTQRELEQFLVKRMRSAKAVAFDDLTPRPRKGKA
jgi:hypothetical protein